MKATTTNIEQLKKELFSEGYKQGLEGFLNFSKIKTLFPSINFDLKKNKILIQVIMNGFRYSLNSKG